MKTNMLLICALGYCCAMAQTNTFTELVSEMPITFEPLEFQFSRDIQFSSTQTEETDTIRNVKESTSDSQKSKKTTKVEGTASAGISHEATVRTVSANAAAGLVGGGVGGGMLGPIPMGILGGGAAGGGVALGAGVASTKTQIELNARLSASASMENTFLTETDQEEIRRMTENFRDTTTRTAKNWRFKVRGRFFNRTTNRYMCCDLAEVKIIVKIHDRVIPLKYNGRGFEILEEAEKYVEFEAEITDENDYALLALLSGKDQLKSPFLTAEVEADFPLYEVDEANKPDKSKLAFHFRGKPPISVDVRFGEFRSKFPLSIKRFVQTDGRGKRELTVREVLIAVSEYVYQKNSGTIFNQERVFKFDNNGLSRVFGVPMGRVSRGENESDPYKMLMMRLGRKWLTRVDDKTLSTLLNGDTVSRSIVFDQIGVANIAYNPDQFSDEVKKDYAEQIEALEEKKQSRLGQSSLVWLYWSIGNKDKMVSHLANAGKLGLDLIKSENGNPPPFWNIILNGAVNDVEKIVGSGRDIVDAANDIVNGQTILSLVIEKDDLDKYKALTRNGINKINDGQTKHIFYASACGSSNIVRWLVSDAGKYAKEDVNSIDAKKYSPLMYAALNGRQELCKFLIDQGADVNQKADKEDVMCDDNVNNHRATRDYIKAMRELKNCQSSWWGAPDYDTDDIMEFLNAGVDVDYRWNFKSHDQWHYSDYGWTFLRWAVVNNETNLVRELAKRGSKVSDGCHRHDGMLPLEYAVQKYVVGKEKKGKADWNVVDELLKADDVGASGFKHENRLYIAKRAIATIQDLEKLKRLNLEKEIDELKAEFLDQAKSDNIEKFKEIALPQNETLRRDWIATVLSQDDTSKQVREFLNANKNKQ